MTITTPYDSSFSRRKRKGVKAGVLLQAFRNAEAELLASGLNAAEATAGARNAAAALRRGLEQNPKTKEEFNHITKSLASDFFQPDIGLGVFEFKGNKIYFKELLKVN